MWFETWQLFLFLRRYLHLKLLRSVLYNCKVAFFFFRVWANVYANDYISNELYLMYLEIPGTSKCRSGTYTFLAWFIKMSCFSVSFYVSIFPSFLPPLFPCSPLIFSFLPCNWYTITVLLLENIEKNCGYQCIKIIFHIIDLKKVNNYE